MSTSNLPASGAYVAWEKEGPDKKVTAWEPNAEANTATAASHVVGTCANREDRWEQIVFIVRFYNLLAATSKFFTQLFVLKGGENAVERESWSIDLKGT